MHQVQSYLEENGIELSFKLLNRLNKLKKKELNNRDLFVKEGQFSNTIAFIIKGKIRHFYNIDGKEYTRWISFENNFVTAFVSFINNFPSNENLICIEDTELLCMSRDEFFALKADFQEIQHLWVSKLETEMTGYERRVMQLITTNAEKRYLDFIETYPEYAKSIPQKYIASMLGIEPRHLSRIRKKLATDH